MMSSTVTSHSTSIHLSGTMGNPAPLTLDSSSQTPRALSGDKTSHHSAINSTEMTKSDPPCAGPRPILPAPPRSKPQAGDIKRTTMSIKPTCTTTTSMSGLLNSRNMDEKLVVATLATLNSGTASNLIKQDLKLIIQSRRKAEGKDELQVEFKKPVKEEQLTSEEVVKRSRRRELNRLAARRSREKGQKRKDLLVEEIRQLQTDNMELMGTLGSLTDQRNQIINTLRQHMKQCSDYKATQKASVGLSDRVLNMLGLNANVETEPAPSAINTSVPVCTSEVPGMSALYISTSDLTNSPASSPSADETMKEEESDYLPSPHKQIEVCEKTLPDLPAYVFDMSKDEPTQDDSLADSKPILHDPYLGISLQPEQEESELKPKVVSTSSLSPSLVPSSQIPTFLEPVASSCVPLFQDTPSSRPDSPSSSQSYVSTYIQEPGTSPTRSNLPSAGSISTRRRSSIASLSGFSAPLPSPSALSSLPSSQSSQPSDSGLGSSQEEASGEEVFHYKHKLMKHRKQYSTDFARPSGSGSKDGNVCGRPLLLERSFSFPSSRCEQIRSTCVPSNTEHKINFTASANSAAKYVFTSCHNDNTNVHQSDELNKHGIDVQELLDKNKSALHHFVGTSSLSSSFSSSSAESSALDNIGSSTSSICNLPSNAGCNSNVQHGSEIIVDKSTALVKGKGSISHNNSSIVTRLTSDLSHHHSDITMQDSVGSRRNSKHFLPSNDTNMESDKLFDRGARNVRQRVSQMDTWPPPGSPRSSIPPWRGLERRWSSVEDYEPMPLNLSRQGSLDTVDDQTTSSRSSRSNSPTTQYKIV